MTEKQIEWRVAGVMIATAVAFVAAAVLFVGSVYFGWGAVA